MEEGKRGKRWRERGWVKMGGKSEAEMGWVKIWWGKMRRKWGGGK